MRVFIIGLFIAGSAWGAQGTNLIGVSAASQAMGGTGVANYTNATDALHKNPAFLVEPTARDGRVVAELNTTYFRQNASTDAGTGVKESQLKSKIIPSVAAVYQLNDKLGFGLGVLSIGGAILDYTGEATHSELKNEKSLVRIFPAAAYRLSDEFSLGISPVINYGAFALNNAPAGGVQSTRKVHGAVGFGVHAGAVGRFLDNLVFGLTYTSKTRQNYKSIIDLDAFGGAPNPGLDDISIEQPQEIAMGASYAIVPEFRVTFDYRHLSWANADGYKQFGWQNQNVFALGAQYQLQKLALRAGFNYAKAPIDSNAAETGAGSVDVQGHSLFNVSISTLDMIAFPGITESHLTLGGGYDFTDDLTVDLAFVYAPKVTRVRAGTIPSPPFPVAAYSFTTVVSQWSLAAGASYQF